MSARLSFADGPQRQDRRGFRNFCFELKFPQKQTFGNVTINLNQPCTILFE